MGLQINSEDLFETKRVYLTTKSNRISTLLGMIFEPFSVNNCDLQRKEELLNPTSVKRY